MGPIDKQVALKKYILVVIDAFSRFVQLYATKTTNAKENIDCLAKYFQCYNTPKVLISDRSSFTSSDFEEFLRGRDIKHVKIATGSPQANGQAERVNWIITPLIAKLSDRETGKQWYKRLGEIEYSLNNTINKSTGKSPSQLIFGMDQRGVYPDHIKEFVESNINQVTRDLDGARSQSMYRMSQQKQKYYFDKRHKPPRSYSVGDMVMIRNFDSTPGVSKKLIPQFRGPYEIKKILGNDRYLLADLPGFQNAQKLYTGIWAASNMRPWLNVKDDDKG